MAVAARWMRLGALASHELTAVLSALASAQAPHSPPILIWVQAQSDLLHGLVRAERASFVFAMIVPTRLAPGRTGRWLAWGLAPAIATYRQFGVRAYLNEEDVWLNGHRIAASAAAAIDGCAVVASSFLPRLAGRLPEGRACDASPEFRTWLRAGLALAASEWAGMGESPAERELETVFRARVEAQHGWRFETAWPSACEREAIARVRNDTAEPLEEALPR